MFKKVFFIAALVIFAAMLSNCEKHNPQTHLTSALEQILTNFPGNPSIGIIVKNMSDDTIVFEKNPLRTFEPASTTKTLTATAALHYLGGDFTFTTKLGITGNVDNNDELNGNVELFFSGDPSLTNKDLNHLLASLVKNNVQTIQGNFVIDSDQFLPYKRAPGVMSDDTNMCFAAPSDAIIVNRNCFSFVLSPSKSINGSATVSQARNLDFITLKHDIISPLVDEKHCPLDLTVDSKNQYNLVGCIPYDNEPYQFDVAIHNPREYLRAYLTLWLKMHNIKLNGDIVFTDAGNSSTMLATHQSKPLYELIQHMLKESDNLYANSLFKTLGAYYLDGDASFENGAKAVSDILKNLGINTDQLNLVEGSGLSRYNRFSPELLSQILQYNYHNGKEGGYFYQGLSIAGKDGTLKHFVVNDDKVDFRGKTGGMYAVRTLAGYLNDKKGTPLSVVIMINGIGKAKAYNPLEASIINQVAGSDV